MVCIASGPSLTETDVEAVKAWRGRSADRRVIVTNTSFRIAPWADVLYAMDRAWWRLYAEEVRRVFHGERVAPMSSCYGATSVSIKQRNSGAGAIALAISRGAEKIILLGYDGRVTDKTHWHGDHPKVLGNAGVSDSWPGQFRDLARDVRGSASIVNCAPGTAIDAFPVGLLADALRDQAKPAIMIHGMHGMGDNLHQRAIVRELMREHEVWLETPWPSLYHDLDVHLVSKGSRLRTQAKNAAREAALFAGVAPPNARTLTVSYPPRMVRQHGSVLAAMSSWCGVAAGDFRLPVPRAWRDGVPVATDRPILVYRPLVERREWGGCRNRNPDAEAYDQLFSAVRAEFFIVSVADLAPGQEWMVSRPVDADATFHAGELELQQLVALFDMATLVFTAPGFAVPLAQAVGTPVISVFGGYEDSRSFRSANQTPYLGIDTVRPCRCFSHIHRCEKRIDIDAATGRIGEFLEHIETAGIDHPVAEAV